MSASLQNVIDNLKKLVNNNKELVLEGNVNEEKLQALSILLQQDYPISTLLFRSKPEIQSYGREKYFREELITCGISRQGIKRIIQALSTNNTITRFEYASFEYNCPQKIDVSDRKLLAQFLARNREYRQKSYEEILAFFDAHELHPIMGLTCIVHSYLCVNEKTASGPSSLLTPDMSYSSASLNGRWRANN